MWSPNVETFIGCDASFAEANVVLYGAPFDSTTSFRPGARFGSSAMRHESFGLETYSPYQKKDLADCRIFDSGDLELCFGDAGLALSAIEERCRAILDAGKFPFLLGGEHLVSLGAMRALAPRYPGLHVVHFDAHADLRDEYLGTPLSHACVLHRCWDLLGDGRIHQFGIRSGDRAEFEWGDGKVETHLFSFDGLAETLAGLEGKPVYFTLDLDVLDPGIFPGTGTPEAGGVSFVKLLQAALAVCRIGLVGCDVVELAPNLDPSGVSTATACKIVREMLLAVS